MSAEELEINQTFNTGSEFYRDQILTIKLLVKNLDEEYLSWEIQEMREDMTEKETFPMTPEQFEQLYTDGLITDIT